MNKYLWSKASNDPPKNLLVTKLRSALSKLPSYQGFVRRGAFLHSEALANHVQGAIVTYEGFTSASSGRGFTSRDRMLIFSKTGKPIMGLSGMPQEQEVLFKSKTKFKVLYRSETNMNNFFILKEVIEGEKDEKILEKEILNKLEEFKAIEKRGWQADRWVCPLDDSKIPKSIVQEKVPGFGT